MKQHTERFKEVITELGKQQDVIITYTIDGKRVELGVEEINSATPRFSSNLLKSVMKELHLDSNVDIPLETEINFKYGLLVDGEFEYLDYGNYIVYSSEKKEDTASYEIVCYDKMLYSMKEYEELAIFYPCTVRSYINAIAGKLGLDFANKNDTFVNYDKELVGDFYLSTDEETQEKKSMGYTYRDVLDDLAEVTASVICINDKDELEVRYITDSINYETTEKSKELKVESEIESQIKILELDGYSTQETRSGKNLLNINLIRNSNIKMENNGQRVIMPVATSGNGITNANVYLYQICPNLKVGDTVILRFETTSAINKYIYLDAPASYLWNVNTELTITEDILNSNFNLYGNRYSSGETGQVIITDMSIMLQTETDTSWEQYGVTPSPEFPSEIHSVGDDVNLWNLPYIYELNKHQEFVQDIPAGTYTLNAEDITSDYSNRWTVLIIFYYEDGTSKNIYIGGTQLKTHTTTLEKDVTRFIIYSNNTLATSQETTTIFKGLKFQKGKIATSYSEYGKGAIGIKRTGVNELKIIDDLKTYLPLKVNDLTMSLNENGTFKVTGNNTTTGFTSFGFDTERTILKKGISYVSQMTMSLYKVRDNSWVGNKKTITPDEDMYFNHCYWTTDIQGEINETVLPMLVQGSVLPKTYEPYKGNNYVIPISQPLRSLPNGVKDTIEEDGIHRRVGSVVLDGSDDETYGVAGEGNTTDGFSMYSTFLVDNISNVSTKSLRSNYFTFIERAKVNSNSMNFITGGGATSIVLNIDRSLLETEDVAGFKKWLQQSPIQVDYELAEEVIEPFDEEQQSVIDSIKTFEGINIINSDAELQIKYPINKDTINEEYLKDTNVTFGEKYGPINAVVLSRSAESDNIYLRDEGSVFSNGLYEIKITDNQIMNQNNRDIYIQDIFDKLKGIEYYLHDLSSTGIMYYNLLDKFDVKVADKIYPIVLFNDEQNISQGLEETLYAELSETTETDYKKAGKDDLKVSLIVDKQNKSINAVVKSNSELEDKTAQLRIDVDRIEGEISGIVNLITEAKGYGTVQINNVNGETEPVYIRIYATNEDIISLKPNIGLFPSVGLYPRNRDIYIKNISSEETYQLIYNIPRDLYQLNGIYDEFILDYETKQCYVIHRIGINENEEKYFLETEIIEYFDYPSLFLTEGDYEIYTPSFNMAYITAKVMIKNTYTSQFATKVELNTKVEQTANSITSSVNQTLSNYDTKIEVNSKIEQTANEINSVVSKKVGENEIISKINQTAEDITIDANRLNINGTISANGNFKVDTAGNMTCKNATMDRANIVGGRIVLNSGDLNNFIIGDPENIDADHTRMNGHAIEMYCEHTGVSAKIDPRNSEIFISNSGYRSDMLPHVISVIEKANSITNVSQIKPTGITTPKLTQTSREESKKNFEKLKNGLDIIKATDIYKYHLKSQKDTDKKEIGFVIGDSYKYAKEITSEDENGNEVGVDTYSMISVAYKAIQEQQEIIEQLQEEIKNLKEEK